MYLYFLPLNLYTLTPVALYLFTVIFTPFFSWYIFADLTVTAFRSF